MDVTVYIAGNKLDLFKDEKISINLNVKNLSDIGKVFSDFTQSFSVPASPLNNAIFTHWYDATVDGTFNANIRVDAYIELRSLPFRYGCVQLENAKLKNGLPQSYQITFYSKAVNLSDKFGSDTLAQLDFSEYDHSYNEDVIDGMNSPAYSDDIYYPLITSSGELSIGTTGPRDLIDTANTISYREFKPALRMIRIIEAIETKYGVTFSRDFFGRALFHNLFMWLHRDAGQMKAFGNPVYIDFDNDGNLDDLGVVVDFATDTVSYFSFLGTAYLTSQIVILPEPGSEDVPYKIEIEKDGFVVSEGSFVGANGIMYEFVEGIGQVTNLKFKISASADFEFTSRFSVLYIPIGGGAPTVKFCFTPQQSISSFVIVSDQMPDMTVQAFMNSLIAQFNLIIKPTENDSFYIDTLDNWYNNGVAYDITKYVDISSTQVKRPDVKKLIEFLYQKAGAILGQNYFDANLVGYGDLKAEFAIDGNNMKIQSGFENMLFERLPNEATNSITEIQAGLAIDKELKPYKGKPFMFYRNGFAYAETGDPLIIQPNDTQVPYIYHTATEDNILLNQVTNSLNFGADLSTYFYSSITTGLYFNFWKRYIEDLYDRKTRLYSSKAVLPVNILYQLALNDRFIIGDKKYKLSMLKVDLTTGESTIEYFTDFSSPIDSVQNIIPLTVDNDIITVDSELYTVDQTYVHQPVTSYVTNGISRNLYLATASSEHFEIAVTANTNWTVTKVSTGDGTGWISLDKVTGRRSGFVRVSLQYNSGSDRNAIVRVTIAGTDYDVEINQREL